MSEQDGDGEPAHHARRPMNAFLIFCKRHRSVVRDKYPNLENRSITKILGEWWANLDKDEKACYTGLAKQYKDAFFNANPDFKWYKLPAPPLRTLSSRPRETTDKPEPSNHDYHEVEYEKTNNNSTEVDLNTQPHDDPDEPKSLSMFTPGKLADEAHMGGLSSLLENKTDNQTTNPFYSPPSFRQISQEDMRKIDKSKVKCDDNIKELQNALSETTRMFEEDFEKGKVVRYAPNEFTNQDVIDQIVDKRYYNEDESLHRNWIEDDKNGRGGRSCKGKRYQEFMAVGGLIVNKRQKRETDRYDDNYPASCSFDPEYQSDEPAVIEDSQIAHEIEIPSENHKEIDAHESDNNSNKTFKAADFDLDAKIRALPSLSLEKFQQKKRDNKRKKKTINFKPKLLDDPIINSVPRPYYDQRRDMERWRENVIGSQKRKPRKISITRLEINSMVSSVDLCEARKISPDIKIGMEAPCTVVQNMEINQASHNVDLLALATLAEVASNTSRIENTSIMDNILANTNDGNASKV